MASTAEKIRERRFDRMRLGQAVCDFVPLVSDPEIRLSIVPLTEAEFLQVLEKVASLKQEDNLAGASVRDRVQAQEILARAIREEDNLELRAYDSIDEMNESLTVEDIDELMDRYAEMTHKSSPALDAIPQEEIENLKVALQTMDWNVLSGQAWYALKRFLSHIMPTPLLDNYPGYGSTNSSITTKE